MENFDRRGFLKIGAILPWGFLSWGDVLRAEGKKDISVIHLFLQGGLSQIDSFDPKPDCDPKFRSPFKTIRTNIPELQVTEHLPLTAKQADKFVTIRSMTHKKSAHGEAVTLLLTGHDALPTLQPPSMGSVVAKELHARNELPPYVWIPEARRAADFWEPPTTRSTRARRTRPSTVCAIWIYRWAWIGRACRDGRHY
jgi:hypothetical protein